MSDGVVMGAPSSSPDGPTLTAMCNDPIPVSQARQQSLFPSTSWVYRSEAALRFLRRQQQRAETSLNLEAAIVQDERGMVALWTRETEICSPPLTESAHPTETAAGDRDGQ